MKTRDLASFVLLTALYACNNNPKRTEKAIDSTNSALTETKTDTLGFTMDSIKIYSKVKDSKIKQQTDTAKAIIVYPVFKDPAVNKFLTDRVIGLAGKQDHYKTYQELTAGFIKEFDNFKKTAAQSEATWFEDLNLKVVANYPNYLSVLYTNVDFKGGAHPNTLFTYFNYNPKTYQTITLDSLIRADGMPKLRAVAEKIFRKNEKLSATASLSEGYFFANNVFTLAETFTVTKEGLKFLYNPYEIKAYAAGTTTLIIPFTEIKDILKPSSILNNFK
ncbi:DUF3298 domain-containing protein [Pedobacter sp. PAMC26386]|nr:DUF3298 domain-containing protein [Pedobacter sp. PAMC26386]